MDSRNAGRAEAPRAWAVLREPTLLLLTLVAFSSVYSSWLPIGTVPASDFYQFWVVGREVAGDQAGNVYSDEERERIGQHYLNRALNRARIEGDQVGFRTAQQRAVLETFSTPFLYTVFGSFSSPDYEADLSKYRTLSLFLVALSVAALCRLLGYGAASTIAAITLFASWFAPSRSDWLVGNVNSFQLGWLVLFLWLSCRFPTPFGHFVGGVLLGLGAMFKPNWALMVGLLFVAWAARRRTGKLAFESAGIAAGAIVAFVWSSLLFGGPGIWKNWLGALSMLPEEIITVELGNYAPARLLSDWAGIDATLPIALLCSGLGLAAVAWGCWGTRPEAADGRSGLEDIHVVALAGLITLLASPLSWLHYFVSTIPMLLLAMRPTPGLDDREGSSILARLAAFVALFAIMMRPLVILDVGTDRSRAVFLGVGVVILLVLALREVLWLRTDAAPARGRA